MWTQQTRLVLHGQGSHGTNKQDVEELKKLGDQDLSVNLATKKHKAVSDVRTYASLGPVHHA